VAFQTTKLLCLPVAVVVHKYMNTLRSRYSQYSLTRYRPLWDVTIAVPVWCRLVTVPTDPLTTLTRPIGPFLSEWPKCQTGNTQNGGTVLPIANLMADSESESPISYSSFLVIIWPSRSDSDEFACDRQTDGDHYYIVAGQLIP